MMVFIEKVGEKENKEVEEELDGLEWNSKTKMGALILQGKYFLWNPSE